ncbi:hypothetical protein M378DRAFT_166885 [Amanita muscaria Koide BX008]|uniref:Uncharacterized protein n=1 Tax=Amanita muscaria (strain Koide BX008) TaxID=946122 RepID=A0A0C2WIS7_AMAMK|nr:hypothetical protein M378DRAFT_166885 [Amanita muscaria Koide BX008]
MATTSSTSASSLIVTVTRDILARALDKMGSTDSVSASLLYDTIIQLQESVPSPSPPPTSEWPGCKITLWNAKAFQNDQRPSGPPYQFNTFRPEPDSEFFDPVRVERRRKVREEMKELYPNGVPDPYVFTNAQFRKDLHNV